MWFDWSDTEQQFVQRLTIFCQRTSFNAVNNFLQHIACFVDCSNAFLFLNQTFFVLFAPFTYQAQSCLGFSRFKRQVFFNNFIEKLYYKIDLDSTLGWWYGFGRRAVQKKKTHFESLSCYFYKSLINCCGCASNALCFYGVTLLAYPYWYRVPLLDPVSKYMTKSGQTTNWIRGLQKILTFTTLCHIRIYLLFANLKSSETQISAESHKD